MSKFTNHKWWIVTVGLTLPAVAVAVPFSSFKSGDVISADQMNQNFANIESRLKTLEALPARVSTLEGKTPSLSCEIRTQDSATPWTATCRSGYFLTGGGCSVIDKFGIGIKLSYPTSTTQWVCDANENLQQVYAICCKAQ